jgi:hypothetical protein
MPFHPLTGNSSRDLVEHLLELAVEIFGFCLRVLGNELLPEGSRFLQLLNASKAVDIVTRFCQGR